ncbi:MAG: hypothetical protein DYG89_37045 [Caldilinea sp. CFX5]|nr:hypothetical protein [Caldilinea sp. CFX5]
MQRIFVETTIQIHRLLQNPATYNTIQATLQTQPTVTSTYVWMEVQRTLGQDYQFLIDLLLTKQPTTIAQLVRYLGVGQPLYSSRRLQRILHIMAYWLEQLNTTAIGPIETAYQLRRQCRRLLHQTFFEQIDQVVDSAACDLIQPDYTIPVGGRMSCRRETARCSLPELLDKNQTALQKLQADAGALTGLDPSTRSALADVATDTNLAKGERNCWALGDVIITLECPTDALLWTTNLRHFEPLCNALGKRLFYPDKALG